MATEQSVPTGDFAEELRKRARFRSHFWPGAGFALLGYRTLAGLGTATIALMPLTLLCFALSLNPFFIWSIIAAVLVYLGFYTAEQLACRSIRVYPGGEKSVLSRFLLPLTTAGYVGLIILLGVCFLCVGRVRVMGAGMAPTLLSGDYVLYERHVFQEDLHSGHVVLFNTSPESSWGKGGDLFIARILAAPGQKLSVEEDHYIVNGTKADAVSPLRKLKASLEVPQAPQVLTIPPGCYFIVQDDPANALDSRVLSWARDSNLIGTRAVILFGHAFAKKVQ